MNFLDYGIDEEEYESINRTIPDVNEMSMYLIVVEGMYCAIDADDSTCHGYYIIISSSFPYSLQ